MSGRLLRVLISATLVAATLTVLLMSFRPAGASPAWLDYVNQYRANVGAPAVSENTSWSAGCVLHAQYMVLNGNVPHDPHQEDPGLPGYTSQGNDCGSNGDVMASSLITTLDNRAIDTWMEGPFHALGIIDPRLQTTGFGSYRGSGTNTQMSAALDVLRGRTGSGNYPVYWPGDGTTVDLRAYGGGESPNPLTSCAGYSAPAGLPLILQLGSGNVTPNVTAHSLVGSGGQLDSCVFDETNYANPDATAQSLGRSILDGRDAVVLIPQQPLALGGTYTASITANGQTYTWTFSISPLQPLTVALDADPAMDGIQSSRTHYLGDSFSVDLVISPGGDVGSIGYGFSYNPSLLSYLGGGSVPTFDSDQRTVYSLQFEVIGIQAPSSTITLSNVQVRDHYQIESGSCSPVLVVAATCTNATIVVNPDRDGDAVLDTTDNCTAWANPTQTLPAWPVPAGDPDCDGFTDTSETFAGTLTGVHCAATSAVNDEPSPDAWPVDFNDDQKANVLDVSQYSSRFNSNAPGPPYAVRYDFNGDGHINVLDVSRFSSVFGKSCTP